MQGKDDKRTQYFKYTKKNHVDAEDAYEQFKDIFKQTCPYESINRISSPQSDDYYVEIKFKETPKREAIDRCNRRLKQSGVLTIPKIDNPRRIKADYERIENEEMMSELKERHAISASKVEWNPSKPEQQETKPTPASIVNRFKEEIPNDSEDDIELTRTNFNAPK